MQRRIHRAVITSEWAHCGDHGDTHAPKKHPVIPFLIITLLAAPLTLAKDPAPPAATDPASVKAQAASKKGLDYLMTQRQPDFSWQKTGEFPAMTALVLKAYMMRAMTRRCVSR